MNQKVLVVDDLPVNTRVLSSILQTNGYDVQAAHSGKEAVEYAQNNTFHCILLDIVMPGMDGFEVIRRLKAIPETAEIPVIFITGKEGAESLAKGFELGAVDYITKPFNKIEVLARLKAHIRLYSTLQSLVNSQADILTQIHDAQNSLLKQPEDLESACFAVLYESLHAAGGDIYDIIQINDTMYGYFVGDFAGHKISTGFLTSSVKALLHQNCNAYTSPVESMRMINSVLVKLMNSGQYMTGCYALLDRLKYKLTVVSMGHPPLIFIPRYGNVREIGKGGDILGVFDQAVFRKITIDMYPGDRVLLYTDGLIEGERVWSAEIPELVSTVRALRTIEDRDTFISRLYEATQEQRGEVDDDVMVLLADFPGTPPDMDRSEENGDIHYRFSGLRRFIDPIIEALIADTCEIVPAGHQYGLKLVLYEALGNAVIHGAREQAEKDITVRLSMNEKKIEVEIADGGRGFDWQEYCDGLRDSFHDEYDMPHLQLSGRGIKTFWDYGYDFTYNDQGNTVTLWKSFSS
ncbi:response regulator [Chitinivibrio alkaliphilus]|uniref:Two-component response regulator n=1 Tax=Chitinivibrio alkaliphilus ACht1 TaxID=1313304 RepID=U7D777_9BACT|nr:response regulator [Chitinivibrio alkaliphilus]ERP31798.1 two-component response regulator [Chitinivibrio alkaliphilus ACht1]